MNSETVTNERFARFLLKDLPPDDYRSLEIDLLTNETLDKFSDVEIALIEKYLSNQLSDRDARLFEKNYLSTQHGREQFQAVKAVASYLDTLPDPSPLGTNVNASTQVFPLPAFRQKQRHFAFPKLGWVALAVMAFIAATIYFVKQERNTIRLRQELEASRKKQQEELRQLKDDNDTLAQRLEQQTAEKGDLEKRLEEKTARLEEERRHKERRPGAGPVYSVEAKNPKYDLFSESTGRGPSQSVEIQLHASARFVTFRLHFPRDNITILSSASIEQIGGPKIWDAPKKPLKVIPSGEHLLTSIQLPVNRLATGNYMVILTGRDKQNQSKSISYQFTVKR